MNPWNVKRKERKFLLVVDDAHADTEDHVHNTENDGELHFVRVQEDDLVVSGLEINEHMYTIFKRKHHKILILKV